MPSFVGILEGINIRLLRPVVVTVEHQEDSQAENNESKDKEEPEEILHIVSEVGSVVLLVPFLNPSTFFIKHLIDLTDMLLHLSGHPFMLFVEHVLNLLPVNIIDSLTETFNLVGASFRTLSMWVLMVSTLPLIVSTALPRAV